MVDLILQYFSNLTSIQKEQFASLESIYRHWNAQINVISRKDIDQIYLHHVLHSLSIHYYTQFRAGSAILDLGCGGGFPGIPLAILYPDVTFHLIDARRKKITVVNAVIDSIGLENCRAEHIRAEEVKSKYDFVLSRAVSKLHTLWKWSLPLIHMKQQNAIPNGLICLKGGDLKSEIAAMPKRAYIEVESIYDKIKEPYFEDKKWVYVQR